MRTLKFIVDGQTLTKDPDCSFSNIVRGSHNYLFLEFIFVDDEWKQYDKAVEFEANVKTKKINFYGSTVGVPDDITPESLIKIRLIASESRRKVFQTNQVYIAQRG